MFMWNIRGIYPKTNQTKVPFLNELSKQSKCKPIAMAIIESHLSEDILDAEINIPGYSLSRTDRAQRERGGVCMYIDDDFASTVLHSLSNSVCETLILKIVSINLVICLMYRPPDCKQDEFLPCLSDIRKTLSEHENTKIIFLGDLNFPQIDWSDTANPKIQKMTDQSDKKIQITSLLELTEEFGLHQLVSKPTRGENTLDLVFSNVTSDLVDCVVTKCESMSDHSIVDMKFPTLKVAANTQDKNSNEIKPPLAKLNFYKSEWDKIKPELAGVDWKNILEGKEVNDQLKEMTSIITNIAEKHTPVKREVKGGANGKNKFEKERRSLWRRRKRQIQQFLRCKNSKRADKLVAEIEKTHREIKRSYENERNKEENDAIDKISENSKYFFSYANQKRSQHSKIGPLIKDGEIINNPEDIAESLQNQFCSVFSDPDENQHINNIEEFFDSDEDIPEINLSDINFSEKDIEAAISEIKPNAACGDDGFSAMLLKHCKEELSVPLTILWRKSLDTSQIPSALKTSKISPIHKGGLKSVPGNYRPVALTSHLIKCFEKIIRNAVYKFLEVHNLLNPNQHGFRVMMSCLSQLLDHFDLLLEILQSNNNADVVYLDFRKAFDVVDHHILLRKLKKLGITGKIGKWIHQFLNDRSQYVNVAGSKSKTEPVISGVPQGSVLGPLLFLIMIGDIDHELIQTIIRTFADDTKVIKEISSADDQVRLQDSLNQIYKWAAANNMTFNDTKFNLVRYGENENLKQNEYYTPSGESIKEETTVKDLGVLMSNDLTFSEHIDKATTKCRKLVYWVFRVFNTRDCIPLLKLYKAMIIPRLDYCSQLWLPYKQQELKDLEGVQRTYTSRINSIKDLDYWSRLKFLKLFSVQRRYERYSIIYTFKVLEGLAPNFTANKIESTYSERRGRMCKIPPLTNRHCSSAVKNAREGSMAIRGPRLFNQLPKYLRNVTGVKADTFKKKLDRYLTQLPDQPTVDGYYGRRAACSNSLLDVIPHMRSTGEAVQHINEEGAELCP